MKKILALVLSIVLVVSFVLTASASHEDVQYEIIDEQLRETIKELGPDDLVSVSIWINEIDYDEVEKLALEKCGINRELVYGMVEKGTDSLLSLDAIETYIATERSLYSERQGKKNNEFLSCYLKAAYEEERVIFISRYSPLLILNLYPDEIRVLEEKKDVVLVTEFHDSKVENCDSISNTFQTQVIEGTPIEEYLQFHGISTLRDNYGLNGQDVKIGMIEPAVPDATLSCFSDSNITIYTQYNSSASDFDEFHASAVASIMVSTDPQALGGVPNAQLYCACAGTLSSFLNRTEHLLDFGVQLINISSDFPNVVPDVNNQYAIWFDHIAIRHSVHLIAAAGNYLLGGDERVKIPALAYNTIAVGNCTQTGIYEESCYATHSGAAYKPDISARGVFPVFATCFSEYDLFSGTSFSSPEVASVVAQMIQYRPSLAVTQDLLKAILMASVSDPNLQFDTVNTLPWFKQLGAGAVNAIAARNTIARGTTAGSYFSASSSSGTTRTYRFNVSTSNTKIRVALAWLRYVSINSNCDLSSASASSLANLDLSITGPSGSNISYMSYTIPGNTEVIQFVPTVPGEYTVTVTFFGPTTARSYYGLAWWAA